MHKYAQVEESYISAEEFCRMIAQDSSLVLQNEVAVLQGLGFDLVVYNPYHPLEGLLQACPNLLLACLPCLTVVHFSKILTRCTKTILKWIVHLVS